MTQELPPAFCRVLEEQKSMAEIVESGVLIRDVETKNIMTKSTPSSGRLFGEPLCRLHPRL